MGFDVAGRTVLVTGANRGIGKAIVKSCLAHGAAKVYAAVRDVDSASALVDAYGDRLVPIPIELSKPETIVEAAQTASDVDLVVNNAGALQLVTPLAENAIESLQFLMEINVYGLIRMARVFAPVLKSNGGGAFVQLNSLASLKSFGGIATYSASKAAAYSLTQAIRELFDAQGTAVLSVHPGPIATDMADAAGIGEIAEPASVVSEGIVTALKEGDFHQFPDAMAKEFGDAYQGFAENILESNMAER